jgi:protein phosphatase
MSQDNRHRITVYAQTDVGMVRAGNEDTFLVLNLDTSDTWTPVTVEGDPPDHFASFEQASAGTILAVSDGMGGALAGEVASRMAVEGVRDHMLFFKSNTTFSAFPFHERLRLAVEQANSQINNESMGNADYAGMGATFTACGVHDGVLTLAQIGDSRCYLIRGGRIALVTHDQSLVWQLVEAGHITEEEAETHQYKNVILQALGAQPRVNVVVDRIQLNDGDTVLLCSDGLSGRVRAEEMLDIVTKSDSLRTACEQLIQLANDRGGEDNITVIVARFEGAALPPPSELTSERVERDPNLPYDVDEELVADAEPTLSPDQLDDTHPVGSDDGTAKGFSGNVTNRLSSAPPSETALLDSSQVPTTAGKAADISSEVAEQIAKLNEKTDFAVPTSVGIPALTPEMIAEHAKARAKAEAEIKASRPKPAEAPGPAPPETPPKGGIKGTLIAAALVAAIAVLVWYVYHQQQAQAAAQREAENAQRTMLLNEVGSLNTRVDGARQRLGQMDPGIAGIPAGPQHDEAVRLRDSVLKKLEDVAPLVRPDAARPETVAEARTLCDRIDADLSRIETIVSAGTPPPVQNPG